MQILFRIGPEHGRIHCRIRCLLRDIPCPHECLDGFDGLCLLRKISNGRRTQCHRIDIVHICQHRVRDIIAHGIGQHVLQAQAHEIRNILLHLPACRSIRDAKQIHRRIHQHAERYLIFCLGQRIDQSQCLSPQREGILRTRWDQAAAERRDHIVDLVRNAHDTPRHSLGLLVSGKARHVVLVNRKRHFLGLAIQTRILASHDALELREFRDHPRDEIRFGKPCRAHGMLLRLRSYAQCVADFLRQLFQTLRFGIDSPKPLLEHHCLELFPMLFQRLLAILIEEELRILQTRLQYALIAVLDNFQIIAAAIPHGDEQREQRPLRRLDREIALMVAHRRNHGLCRKLQIFLLEFAAKRGGIFHQIEHFFQKVFCDFRDSAILLGCLLNLFADHGLALFLIHDDELLLASLLVFCRIRNLKIALAQEPMSS